MVGGGGVGYVASAFIFILISSSTALPPGLMCFQDWIDLDFGAEVGELRLNLVKLGDNQVFNSACFHFLHESIFKVTAWFDGSTYKVDH